MRHILFYTPMNPALPGAPPSGDRTMAALLARALAEAGYEIEPASTLRSYEPTGNAAQQKSIADAAEIELPRLIAAHRAMPPAAWVTYMNYHRAPDYLGPAVSAALGVPYAIVEASHAEKRREGNFAAPHAAATRALLAAHAVLAMSNHDAAGLARIVSPDRLHRLAPFIDTAPFAAIDRRTAGPPLILSVAMLRSGKKLANFALIASALSRLADLDWHYIVAGDGPGRATAEGAFSAFPKTRLTFAGAFPPEAMPKLYGRAAIYLWPGLREGYGLAYLETQAAGTPVVACATAGVPAVVEAGRGGLLVPPDDPVALADALRVLLLNRQTRETMGEVAREFVMTERNISIAAHRLKFLLHRIGA